MAIFEKKVPTYWQNDTIKNGSNYSMKFFKDYFYWYICKNHNDVVAFIFHRFSKARTRRKWFLCLFLWPLEGPKYFLIFRILFSGFVQSSKRHVFTLTQRRKLACPNRHTTVFFRKQFHKKQLQNYWLQVVFFKNFRFSSIHMGGLSFLSQVLCFIALPRCTRGNVNLPKNYPPN